MEIFFSKFRYKFLAQGIRNLCCCIDRLVYLSVFYLYIIGFYFCWNVFIFQKGGGWNSFSRKDILYFIKPFEKFFSLVLDRAQFLRCKLSQFIYWLFIYWELFFPLDFSFFFFSSKILRLLLLHKIYASLWNWFRTEINFSIISRAAYLRARKFICYLNSLFKFIQAQQQWPILNNN